MKNILQGLIVETACTDKIANCHSYGHTEAGHVCVDGAVLSVLWT